MEMKAVRGRYPVVEQMDKAVRAGVDAFLVCAEADLQAECIEQLIYLQEQHQEHEFLAEQSLHRLQKLMRKRAQLAEVPAPQLSEAYFTEVCAQFTQGLHV
jgi:beta-glucosidase-like glycosyl hydrolase